MAWRFLRMPAIGNVIAQGGGMMARIAMREAFGHVRWLIIGLAFFGMGLIVSGVVVINLFSSASSQ